MPRRGGGSFSETLWLRQLMDKEAQVNAISARAETSQLLAAHADLHDR